MTIQKGLLSPDQQAKADFVMSAGRLRELTSGGLLRTAPEAVDAFTAATLAFGTCELRMRRSERLTELGLFEDEAAVLRTSALERNAAGIEALLSVRPLLEELAGQASDNLALDGWREASGPLRQAWREKVSELDVGRSDAQHLARMMDECCDGVDRDGLKGLATFLRAQLDELESVRQTPERGTWSASFPWWKIVAAAVWLGISVLGVWNAITRGAAWWDVAMVVFIALVGTVLIALGC